jgi:hypothetical protein
MAFLSKTASATVNATAGGNYLSPSKLSDGGSVRFALLTDTPLEFHESWGQKKVAVLQLSTNCALHPVKKVLTQYCRQLGKR